MPAYNEAHTLGLAIQQVLAVDFPCPVELIVVDDGSHDETPRILAEFAPRDVRVVIHPRNLGKGAAVRTGVNQASGSHLIILDADLEYSPTDIPAMLEPVLAGRANHVFGTRVFGINTCFRSFRFAMGGRLLTLAANVLYDSCLTDMHTCLKLIPLEQFRTMTLTENGFGMDTEITARLLRDGVRPFEIPITYAARSIEEGKKIGWRDGIRCVSILAKIRAERRCSRRAVEQVAHEMRDLFHGGCVVVNKPAVPVGTAAHTKTLPAHRDIAVVSNPEFLREGSAVAASLHPDGPVVGSDQEDVAERAGGRTVLPAGHAHPAHRGGQCRDGQVPGQLLPGHEDIACQRAGRAVRTPRRRRR